jgi:hypothetical protein
MTLDDELACLIDWWFTLDQQEAEFMAEGGWAAKGSWEQ